MQMLKIGNKNIIPQMLLNLLSFQYFLHILSYYVCICEKLKSNILCYAMWCRIQNFWCCRWKNLHESLNAYARVTLLYCLQNRLLKIATVWLYFLGTEIQRYSVEWCDFKICLNLNGAKWQPNNNVKYKKKCMLLNQGRRF